MELSRRGFIAAGAAAAASVAPSVSGAAEATVAAKPKAGELNNELLGTLLKQGRADEARLLLAMRRPLKEGSAAVKGV